jgi:hypothetical protein
LQGRFALGRTTCLSLRARVGGVLDSMEEDERALGDPGYVGHPMIVCPRRNMLGYIPGLGDVGLTLQRVVERNRLIRSWAIMQSFRGSPTKRIDRIRAAGWAVAVLLSLDMRINEYEFY